MLPGKGGRVMPKPGERTRIAVLIVVAVIAIAFAMFEARAGEPGGGPADTTLFKR
jgi:hypothetical protein